MSSDQYTSLNDAFLLLQILRRIPATRAVSSRQIKESLALADMDIPMRRIQRYLKAMVEAPEFGIDCNDTCRPFSYRRTLGGVRFINTPLSTNESLLIRLAELSFENKLPQSMTESLEPLFTQAQAVLKESSPERKRAAKWLNKIAVVPATLPRELPTIRPRIFEAVTQALFEEKQLKIDYQKRDGKSYKGLITPLGLVHQQARMYLIAYKEDGESIRHWALHRFKAALVTKHPSLNTEGFDLAEYLKDTTFNYGLRTHKFFRLISDNAHLMLDLTEAPLSKTQKLYTALSKPARDALAGLYTVTDKTFVCDFVLEDSRLLDSFLGMWVEARPLLLECPVEDFDEKAYWEAARLAQDHVARAPMVPYLVERSRGQGQKA